MADLESYLANNKECIKVISASGAEEETSVLVVVILCANDEYVLIGHLGHTFRLQNHDVLSVEDEVENFPNLFGRGRLARIAVRKTAFLVQEERLPVTALEAGIPFAIARPSIRPSLRAGMYTPRELVWRNSYALPTTVRTHSAMGSNTYTVGTTLTWSASQSEGVQDDSSGDDSNLDDADNFDDTSSKDLRAASSYTLETTVTSTISQAVQDDANADDTSIGDPYD